MFPGFIVPAMGAFGGMAYNEAKTQFFKHAPDIINDVFEKGRNTLQGMLNRYKKSKTTLKKNKMPSRTMKTPQRRLRKRIG